MICIEILDENLQHTVKSHYFAVTNFRGLSKMGIFRGINFRGFQYTEI